jgi:hypothetical protein
MRIEQSFPDLKADTPMGKCAQKCPFHFQSAPGTDLQEISVLAQVVL